jgi:class 3 adenylate cyclase
MSVCLSCGAANSDGARFCAACGSSLGTVCAHCGLDLPEVARFCPSCGSPVAAHPEAERQRKVISVLFVDLVGYSARSESTDAEDVRELLGHYFERVSAEIERFGGVVEKFIGDAVMAVFGAPVTRGDDAERAVRAALRIPLAIVELNAELSGSDLRVRVGVNTGEAVVELDPSSDGAVLVVGDMVNTASRLQSAAPPGRVLVGEETHRATLRSIRYERAEPIVAKNKKDPVPVWLAVEPLEGPARHPAEAPFVGRGSELDLLRDVWGRATAGRHAHLATILGEPGIGKSRLTSEFENEVEASGGRTLQVRELPYAQSAGYEAFGQLVKQVAGIFELDSEVVAVEKLARALDGLGVNDPGVVERLSVFVGTGEAPAENRREVFDAARRFVEALAHDRSTLIVFDDIHWAHPSMLDLIESLAVRAKDAPILFLCLSRPGLLDIRPAWGSGQTSSFTIRLDPLTADEGHMLATWLTAALGDDIAERIEATAGGNPLFIEEMSSWVAEGGGQGVLPTTVQAMIAARIDALPKEERSVLNDASVVGKVFWRDVLAGLGTGGDALDDILESLESRDVIRTEPSSSVEGDREFAFRHILIRDVAYATLTRDARRSRHRAVAALFEQTVPDIDALAAILAYHWKEAGDPERAVDYLLSAAERAEIRRADAEAVNLYEEALSLIPKEDQARRRTIGLRRGVAAFRYEHSVTDEAQLRRAARADPASP